MKNYLILLAGGSGSRMNSDIAKQHIIIQEHQIIEYTLTAFSSSKSIDYIVVVSNPSYLERVEKLKGTFPKIKQVVSGGETRMKSVYNGVKAVESVCDDNDKILISDAARPCITIREIDDLIASLDNHIAVTSGLESYETILKVENGEIEQILKRDGLIRQTSPEGYRFKALKWLYLDASDEIISSYRNIGIDQLFGSGQKIGIIKSNPLNFKITTQDDLQLFETVVKKGFDDFIKQ